MDKEDALVCFEQVIKDLEQEYDEERDRKRVLERRMFRKNRERFIGLLNQMKSQGHIHSLAIFSDLYPRFITDKRFTGAWEKWSIKSQIRAIFPIERHARSAWFDSAWPIQVLCKGPEG